MSDTATPNPGSYEAVEQGCRCPVFDNAHGKGHLGHEGIFVITRGCPLHDTYERDLFDVAAGEYKAQRAEARKHE